MAGLLFGLETEYALAAFDEKGQRCPQDTALIGLINLARQRLTHVRGFGGADLFLPCGRLYLDTGGHPEFCTPECDNPWDVVRYSLAGDRIVSDLARDLAGKHGIAEVVVSKCNVDYADPRFSWGCHESYLHRRQRRAFPEEIIPHLVSRIIYTGAGGFDVRAPGKTFMISPRASHLAAAVGENSTHERPIFHTKNEPLAGGGYRRLHLLCGESLCSEKAAWLKIGATALVAAMVDAGKRPGHGVRLPDPLGALRAFAADPEGRAAVDAEGGRRLRALDIQRHYLEQAEAYEGDSFMPAWAGEVCRGWREALDLVARGPEAAARTLDWAIKLDLFKRFARRRCKAAWPDAASPRANSAKLRWALAEIDFRFGQLGGRGIFPALEAEGVLSHRVPGVSDTGQPLDAPPLRGRARVRAERIAELAEANSAGVCDWTTIIDYQQMRVCDMPDPFAENVGWMSIREDADACEANARDPQADRIRERLFLSGLIEGPRQRATLFGRILQRMAGEESAAGGGAPGSCPGSTAPDRT